MGTKKFYGYKVVAAAAILSMLHQGCTAIYSLFLLDMADHTGSSLAAIGYMATISLFVSAGSSVLLGAGRVVERIGPKKCLYASSVLCAIAYFIMGIAPTLPVIYIGVIFLGVDIALGCIATLSVLVEQWFIERRSQMLGIVLGCGLLGSSIMIFIASRINAIVGTYTTTYYIVAVIILAIGILINLLVIRTPEQVGQKPLGWEKAGELNKAEDANTEETLEGVSLKGIFSSFSFWAMIAAVFVFTFTVDSIAIYAPTYCVTYGLDEITSSNLYMLYLFMGFVGALISGWVDSKLGHRAFITCLGICLGVGMGMTAIWSKNGSMMFIGAAMFIAGLGIQACNQSGPTLGVSLFGRKHYPTVCNYITAANCAGTACIAPIMNISLNVTGGMEAEFTGSAIATLVSVVLVIIALQVAPMKKLKKEI